MATAVASLEGRRAHRDIVSFRAPLDGPAGMRTSILVVDVSPLGFMSRATARLAPGDHVTVKLPVVGDRAARIIWAMGGRVGGEFVEAIDDRHYDRLLANAPRDKPAWNEF